MKFLLTYFNLIVASWACELFKQSIDGQTCDRIALEDKCPELENTCTKYTEKFNCPAKQTCEPSIGPDCPDTCPQTCKANEILCPVITDPDNLCIGNEYALCQPKKVAALNSWMDWCDNPCPQQCTGSEVECTEYNTKGCPVKSCKKPEECVTDTTGCPEGDTCCNVNTQITCEDPSNYGKFICVSNAKVQRSERNLHTPDNCPEGQVACAGAINEMGCPLTGSCVDNEEDCPYDWQGCLRSDHLNCPQGEMACGDYNSDGCPTQTCQNMTLGCPEATHYDNGCPIPKDPECKGNQKSCPRGQDSQGCNQSPICVDYDATFLCDPCEPECEERTQKVCIYQKSARGQCPEKRCVDKATPCEYYDQLQWIL